MGNRLSKAARSARKKREHESEAWCLAGSVTLGTWAAAGLTREVIDGEVAGYWKIMSCGCLFVLEVVVAE